MVDALRRFAALIDRLNLIGAWAAALACTLLAAMLVVEAFTTAAIAWSQPWAVEYASYFCAITLFGGAGYALRHAAHIRVAVALHYLPGRLRRLLDIACTLAALAVTALLAYGLIDLALRSFERGSKSYFVMQTPLAWPQGALAVSVVLLLLALVARLVRLLINDPPDLEEARAIGEGSAE